MQVSSPTAVITVENVSLHLGDECWSVFRGTVDQFRRMAVVLHDVREFVHDEPHTADCVRRVRARSEDDMRPDRVGGGAEPLR